MKNQTVLVIEDSPELADSLNDLLTLHGYTPLIATTGRDGVRLALEAHPDLILLDIRLPDIDGYAVFQQIRQDDWGAEARIMVLTASESVENISKNISLPVGQVLFKPNLSITELVAKIEERLGATV